MTLEGRQADAYAERLKLCAQAPQTALGPELVIQDENDLGALTLRLVPTFTGHVSMMASQGRPSTKVYLGLTGLGGRPSSSRTFLIAQSTCWVSACG